MTADTGNSAADMDPRLGLAAERTLLAWVRTGLAMMGFGFIVAKFRVFLHQASATQSASSAPSAEPSLWIGATLVGLGVVVNVMAASQHIGLLERMKRGETYRPSTYSLGVVVTLLLAGLGLVLATYLFATRP